MSSTRSHPVHQALRHCGHGPQGTELSSDELDELRLPPAQRRQVAEAARKVAATRASGANQEAERLADAAAFEVIDALPEAQQDPDFYKPTPDEPTDPHGLAAMVKRGW